MPALVAGICVSDDDTPRSLLRAFQTVMEAIEILHFPIKHLRCGILTSDDY